MRKGRTVVAASILLTAVLSGCRSGSDGSPFSMRRGNQSVALEVDNNNFLDITVYAIGAGATFKLGDVAGKSIRTFRIDPQQVSMVSGLQLQVDPLGSAREYLSPVVYPDRGAEVVLVVGANLNRTFITIR